MSVVQKRQSLDINLTALRSLKLMVMILMQWTKFLQSLERSQKKPALIVFHTIIGKGSPHKAGSHTAHGSPLGPDEVKATKEALGLPLEEFYIPQAVISFFEKHREKLKGLYDKWRENFDNWAKTSSKLYQDFETMASKRLPDDLESKLKALEVEDPNGRSFSFSSGDWITR